MIYIFNYTIHAFINEHTQLTENESLNENVKKWASGHSNCNNLEP